VAADLTGVFLTAWRAFLTARADLVPLTLVFFAVSASGLRRNFRFQAGLFFQLRRGDFASWKTELIMLSWVVTFLIIALIAGVLGFGGIAGASVEIAKIIFFVAVVLFLISAVVGLARGRTRV
jgi:uncharacterized membrane protein YtjA (UPF0391 family)